jgi:glycolate oxidase
VTEVTLRLLPAPRAARSMLVPFPTVEAAAEAVPAIIASGLVPRCLEFMEREALRLAEHHLGRESTSPDGEAFLLVELDGPDRDLVTAQTERVAEVCLERGAIDCLMPDASARQEELWAIRRAAGEAVKKSSVYKEEDTVVPPARLPELVRGVKAICAEHGVTAVAYGHAGDGNIHMNLLKRGLADEAWERDLPTVIKRIFELTVQLGGSITGEHGVGLTQRPYLGLVRDEATLALYRRLKAAFDPEGLLNPAKVLP